MPYGEPSTEPESTVYFALSTSNFASANFEPEPKAESRWIPVPKPEPENNTDAFPEPTASTTHDPTVMSIMAVVAGMLGCAIIIENIIVILVIIKAWPKQNPTITYFILHLACADLTSGLQFLWFNCIDMFLKKTHEGYWVLALCGIWMVTIAASIGGIVNFAHLRIHALKNAMKNQKYSKKRAVIAVTLSWLLPLLVLFLPPMAGWNCIDHPREKIRDECSQVVFPFTKAYSLLLVALLLFATIWISVLYVWIFTLVHKRLKAVRGISAQSGSKDTERQLFNTMMLILCLFFVCHFPVALVLVFDFLAKEPSPSLIDAFQIILTISFVNAFLNPIVYYWRMPATRDSFWLALGRKEKTQNKIFFSSVTVSRKIEKNNTNSLESCRIHKDIELLAR